MRLPATRYVRADYDFCRMGESYRDLFDYVCGQWYLDEHKAIGVAFAVGLTMVAIVLLLFFWSTKRGQKRQRSLLKRQGRHGKGAAAAEEELGPRTHMPLSQADNVVVVLDGEKPDNHSPPAWEKNQKAADNHSPLVDEGGPSSESESGEPGNSAACHTGEFEIDVAQTVKLTTVRAAPA